MFKSKDKAIKQLQETLGEMGYDGDVTSNEAREFWETNKGKLPQKYFEKYGDNAIDFIGNNFTTLGQKTSTPSDNKKTVEKNNASAVKLAPKATKTEKTANDYSLDEVLKVNNNDPTKVREWLRNNPSYEQGAKTKEWLNNNPIPTDSIVAEGLDDSEVVENLGDESKKTADDLTKMNDEWVKSLNDSYSNIEDNYSENIPTYLWSMYKNGEFDGTSGDEKKDKKIGKERFGYLLLNQLGNNLVNASLIARGSAPSAESDLQKIRREKLEGGLERYNEKRKSTMNNLIEQIGLDGKLLAEYNMDVDKLATNQKFARMAKALDRKDMERTLKAYKFAGDYLANVPDEEKSNIFLTIMALNSNDGTSAGIAYLTSVLGKPATDKILGFLKDK